MYFRLVAAFSAVALLLIPELNADALSIGSATVNTGDTFNIAVDIAEASDLYGFQFDVTYDPSILQLQSISEGPFLATAGSTFFIPGTIDNGAGDASSNADSLLGPGPGAAGSGTLAILDFRAIASGTSALSLANIILLDSNLNNIAFTSTDGSVTVSSPSVPEPSSWAFAVAGLLLLGAFRLRNHNRTARLN